MDLYLIRHGESTANRDHEHAAWLPVPLTEAGKEQARAAAFLKQMEALPEDVQRIAAVSHGGLIRAMAAHLVHQPLGKFPMAMSNCGISVLRFNRKKGEWNIVHWNIGCELADANATDGIGK